MNVSPIPTTRIDKDHPKDQIIGDLNSAIQTRRMTKIYDEHAMGLYGTNGCKEVPSYTCYYCKEVLVQPPSLKIHNSLNKVYKVERALSGLHQLLELV
ncbi:hypothetical protein Tco_1409499 [Tanacetum coccineum]